MSDNGEIIKAFNLKDGYALARLANTEITPIITIGRKSKIVEKRAQELKITEIHQAVDNKSTKLIEVCKRLNISSSQCAYIGDDLNDLECMQACGVNACPSDAVVGIKEVVDYVCKSKGRDGAVREFCDYFIY